MSFIDDQKDKINAAINEHKNSAFSYVENVQKLKDNFNKEVSDTYKDIIGETLGPSFKALIHILTQAFSGIAVNYINSAASVLAGTISTANSFLTLSMLSSRGIDIILRYKAAKALQESLQTRLKLSNALYVDIQQTLETLNKLSKLKSSLADTYFQNLNLALNHINAASLIIGKERSKTNIVRGTDDNGNPNRAGYVNSRNLEAAIYNIDKAVEYLLSGNIDTNDFLFDIKQLNRKYGVRTKAPLVLGSNPIVAANYMASSVRELYEKQGKDRAFEYISDYVALSPTATYLRGLAGVKYFGAYYSTLGRKLPVDSFLVVGTGAQNLVAKASTALGNNAISVNTVWDSVFSFLGGEGPTTRGVYPNTNDSLLSISKSIERREFAVLALPDLLKDLQLFSNANISFLGQATNALNDVKASITEKLKEPQTKVKYEEQFGWLEKLSEARAYTLASMSSDVYNTETGQVFSVQQTVENFANAQALYISLQNAIVNKLYDSSDPDNPKPRDIAYKQALDIANKTLSLPVINPVVLFSPSERQKSMNGLQAILRVLDVIIVQDQEEEIAAKNFINSLESDAFFMTVILRNYELAQKTFMDFADTLGIKDKVEDLLKYGDLSTYSDYIKKADYASDALGRSLAWAKKNKAFTSVVGAIELWVSKVGFSGLPKVDLKAYGYRKKLENAERALKRLRNKAELLKSLE